MKAKKAGKASATTKPAADGDEKSGGGGDDGEFVMTPVLAFEATFKRTAKGLKARMAAEESGEAEEAKAALKALGADVAAAAAADDGSVAANGVNASLMAMFKSREIARSKQSGGSFLDSLEARYVSKPKKSKKAKVGTGGAATAGKKRKRAVASIGGGSDDSDATQDELD